MSRVEAEAREEKIGLDGLSLRTFALAAAASGILRAQDGTRSTPEGRFLLSNLVRVAPDGGSWVETMVAYMASPAPSDGPLLDLADQLRMAPVEILSASLAAAVEDDLMAGRALAFMQAPVGGSRPTFGFLCSVLEPCSSLSRVSEALLSGPALASGLLSFMDDRPLPERSLGMPLPLFKALCGYAPAWPDAVVGMSGTPEVPLPPSALREAGRHASALAGVKRCLVVRTPSAAEGRTAIDAICRQLGSRPLFLEKEALSGLGPFLRLESLTPVFCCILAPGERKVLPLIRNYEGPVLALAGPDGSIEAAGGAPISWALTVPSREERRRLWLSAVASEAVAEDLARHHRHGAGRIAHLGRLAQHQSALRGAAAPSMVDVVEASWSSEGSDLDALAEPLRDPIPDDALVLPPTVRAELELLLLRCRARDGLPDDLGPSARTRYRSGVKALLTGPSGSGKTLATGWLATKLGIPLYRVDLSAVMSKYIGETEKNLAQLLARAEQSDIMLLFDEADSLFGKRTDVKEANDRFANAQTNYLLQRIESFDGITLLTSNSRNRFDAAFTRRLDAIVEFSLPGPEERRSLWLSHLGDNHCLTSKEVNQLAAVADLAGGHIRNAVLTAAVLTFDPPRPIDFTALMDGLAAEYRKLGRQLPAELPSARLSYFGQ
jgi:hypothetical protein